jgi:hypothetical protein
MLHSETYNVQDFVLDITQMMVLWLFIPCDVFVLTLWMNVLSLSAG